MHKGMFDSLPTPAKLPAYVVSPAPDPRIHGYAVTEDLARHASFVDVGWLALTGELPTPGERAALERALILLSPLHVGEGPTHAAVLARVAGASDEVIAPIAATALGQYTAEEISQLAPLFAWLEGQGAVPDTAVETAPTPEQRHAYEDTAARTAEWLGAPLPSGVVLTRVATAYALLYRLGVADPLRLQALSCWARMPVVFAEAACNKSGRVAGYPARLPDYAYVEDSQ